MVYQIDAGCKRLLWVGKDRTVKTLLSFFRTFGRTRSAQLQFVCSDMWKPYLKVLAKKAGQAIHVLDRFHIAMHMHKAINEVRAAEARDLKAKGLAWILKHARWCLLKRPENLTPKQEIKLAEVLSFSLKVVRCYLLKEAFQIFWDYHSPDWAAAFLDQWCQRVMRSRIEPMKRVARMLRSHRDLLLNWFRAKGAISAAITEGFNNRLTPDDEKTVRFSDFYSRRTRALSHAWRTT